MNDESCARRDFDTALQDFQQRYTEDENKKMPEEGEDYMAFLADVTATLFGLLVMSKKNPLSDHAGFAVFVAGAVVEATLARHGDKRAKDLVGNMWAKTEKWINDNQPYNEMTIKQLREHVERRLLVSVSESIKMWEGRVLQPDDVVRLVDASKTTR